MSKYSNDFSDAVFSVCVLIAFILFLGEPDLHDALIKKLNNQCEVTE